VIASSKAATKSSWSVAGTADPWSAGEDPWSKFPIRNKVEVQSLPAASLAPATTSKIQEIGARLQKNMEDKIAQQAQASPTEASPEVERRIAAIEASVFGHEHTLKEADKVVRELVTEVQNLNIKSGQQEGVLQTLQTQVGLTHTACAELKTTSKQLQAGQVTLGDELKAALAAQMGMLDAILAKKQKPSQ
jgi:chromosome segregation ATPase